MSLHEGDPSVTPNANSLGEESHLERSLATGEPKTKSRVVDVFSNVRQKIRPRDYIHHLEERARPGALTAVGALDAATSFILPAAETTVAAGINAAVKTDSSFAIPALAATIGALTAISIRQEVQALRRERFSATTVGTLAYTLTGEARTSSAINHVGNYLGVTLILNPVTAYAVFTNNPQLLVESFATTPLVLTPWYILVNSVIASGRVDKLFDLAKKIPFKRGK